jgi:hypothetical protein
MSLKNRINRLIRYSVGLSLISRGHYNEFGIQLSRSYYLELHIQSLHIFAWKTD